MLASFYFCLAFLSAAVTANDRYWTWCEDNNIPDDKIFAWPGSCEWYIWCREGETVVEQCDPEGSWIFPGPGNTMGTCDWPEEDAVCDDSPLQWPPMGGECPPGGGVVLLPSEFCDTFYVCV
jgi:Chitin binding Peritrophin-A domain